MNLKNNMLRKKKIVAIEEFDLELCGVRLRKYDQLIQGWLENDTHTLSKPYILRRFWNQLIDFHLREKNNVVDLLDLRFSKGGKGKLMELLKKYNKEKILEEDIELAESELAEFKEIFIPWKGFTLQDLEVIIDRIRKTSYLRRLKEYEEEWD